MGRRTVWRPLTDLITMQQAMDRLFEEATGDRGYDWRREQRVEPLAIDAYSTSDELVIVASVPGANPEEVEITIEGETLTIRGETKPPLENVEYVIQERRYGPFARTLTLNVPVRAEQAEAFFQNGVLTLAIPKAEEVKPKVIKVTGK